MKKFIAVLLSVMFAFSCMALCASAEETPVAGATDETKVTLGSYPQSKVTDETVLAKLDATLAKNEETKAVDFANWTSYGYYFNNPSNFYKVRSWADGKMSADSYYTKNIKGETGASEQLIGSDDDDCKWDGIVMRYIDVEVEGQKYRGVYIGMGYEYDGKTGYAASYRPTCTGYTTDVANSVQKTNGYTSLNIYWFKYEPLTWEIIDSARNLAVCTTLIDSQPYNNFIYRGNNMDDETFVIKEDEEKGSYHSTYNYFTDSPYEAVTPSTFQQIIDLLDPPDPENFSDDYDRALASDYSGSSIREWLNSDFYNTAFSDDDKAKIGTAVVKNSGYYTLTGDENHTGLDSATTNDKVFLLSYDEVKNANYFADASALTVTGTDYAACQGLSAKAGLHWFLRTPGKMSCLACSVDGDGEATDGRRVNDTCLGVRPAIIIGADEVSDEEDGNFFQTLIASIKNFFRKIVDWFKGLFD